MCFIIVGNNYGKILRGKAPYQLVVHQPHLQNGWRWTVEQGHGGGLGKAGDFFLFCPSRLKVIFFIVSNAVVSFSQPLMPPRCNTATPFASIWLGLRLAKVTTTW